MINIKILMAVIGVSVLSGCGNVVANLPPSAANQTATSHVTTATNVAIGSVSKPLAASLPVAAASSAAPLKDTAWVQDPVNYETSQNDVVNDHVSIPILEYHDANYVPGDVATLMPGQLVSEINWLHDHGFHTINFGQLYGAMYYGYQLPSRPVLLSFDDGYESVYFKVFPLLKKYHDQATLFIVKNFTHTSPNRNSKFPTLTISELQEMQESGLVDIEDHTVSHPMLSHLSASGQRSQVDDSTLFLEGIAQHKMFVICYPFGDYNRTTIEDVKNAGYLLGVTEHQGYANVAQGPYTLDRITILSSTSLSQFAQLLSPSLGR